MIVTNLKGQSQHTEQAFSHFKSVNMKIGSTVKETMSKVQTS